LARVLVRARARRDIREHADYLLTHAGEAVTERFLTAVSSTFEHLADMPKMGSLCGFQKPALRRVRRWRVEGFENWLIFYIPRRDGVEIIHVIHGARDIEALFGR
jgi:toxin ParE1/3/4